MRHLAQSLEKLSGVNSSTSLILLRKGYLDRKEVILLGDVFNSCL